MKPSPTLPKSSTPEIQRLIKAGPAILRALSQEKRQQLQRETARARAAEVEANSRTLYGFMQEFWPVLEPTTPFVGGRALEAICDHLEAVSRGEINRLLITVPPGMSKSLTTGVFFPAWEWGPRGLNSRRYLATSYSGPNVQRDTEKMRTLVECEDFQRIWGHLVRPSKKWGEKLIRNLARGQREGRPFGSMTGGRGDVVIIDDPHSTKTAESDVERAATVQIFREQLTDRLNDVEKSAIIVIMQRLHEGDVAGEILKLNDQLEQPYVHLNLPMEFEPTRKVNGRIIDNRCRTYVGGDLFFEDWREIEGELLFPERFSRSAVNDLKTAKGSYAYSGQYQQRPTPREGGMFKREWFNNRILRELPDVSRWVRAWDLAGTDKRKGKGGNSDPDYTVGLKMGITADGRYVIAHVRRFQKSPGQTRENVKATAKSDGQAVEIRIPEDVGQAGKDQALSYVQMLAGHVVRAVRPTGSKETRAEPFSVQCEARNVWLMEGPWNDAFLDELCTFPMARHDDQVDAASDAFNTLAPMGAKDDRVASAGPRRMIGATPATAEELIERASGGYAGGTQFSAPGRRTGIL